MNHLKATINSKKSFWRYILIFLKYLVMAGAILIVSNTIGALPLITTVFVKSASNPEVLSSIFTNPNDFSVLGLDPNLLLIMMLFPFIAGLLAFMFLIKPLHNRTLKITINGTAKIRWNHFFISGGVWLILSGFYLFFYMKFDPSNFEFNNKTFSLLTLSLISILLIPFQAAFEEVIFRGYLMQGFASLVRNRWFPLVITSVLFALMHALNPEVKEFGFITMMPQYILFGLIFGIITILDDGIEAAMGAHAANNIFLCIMVTNKASALQTPALYEQLEIFPWLEFTGLFFCGIVFILTLRYFLKWESFKPLWGKIKEENPLTTKDTK